MIVEVVYTLQNQLKVVIQHHHRCPKETLLRLTRQLWGLLIVMKEGLLISNLMIMNFIRACMAVKEETLLIISNTIIIHLEVIVEKVAISRIRIQQLIINRGQVFFQAVCDNFIQNKDIISYIKLFRILLSNTLYLCVKYG